MTNYHEVEKNISWLKEHLFLYNGVAMIWYRPDYNVHLTNDMVKDMYHKEFVEFVMKEMDRLK